MLSTLGNSNNTFDEQIKVALENFDIDENRTTAVMDCLCTIVSTEDQFDVW